MSPTSHPTNKALFRRVVAAHAPGSVLDVCAGTGEYGTLTHELLPGRIYHAVEVWPPNVGHHEPEWKTRTGNALDVLDELGYYHLALLLGALEHFEREDGERLLALCSEHATSTLVVTPHSPSNQGAVDGNDYERHRSKWAIEDFDGYAVHDLSDKARLRVLFGSEPQGWWATLDKTPDSGKT